MVVTMVSSSWVEADEGAGDKGMDVGAVRDISGLDLLGILTGPTPLQLSAPTGGSPWPQWSKDARNVLMSLLEAPKIPSRALRRRFSTLTTRAAICISSDAATPLRSYSSNLFFKPSMNSLCRARDRC